MATLEMTDKIGDIKERFLVAAERLPDEETTEMGLGAMLLAAGVAVTGVTLSRERRGFAAWALPGALLSSGMALLFTGLWQRRSNRILGAEEVVRGELERLDPIARGQVLKNVAEEQVGHFMPEES